MDDNQRIYSCIGQQILQKRLEQNLGILEIADYLNLSYDLYIKIEKGTVDIYVDELLFLSLLFNTDINYFFPTTH